MSERSETDPRVARTRAAVLAATCDALVEEGYAGVTIDGISRRCGVARTTIYRHWASMPDLVIDAVRSLKPPFEAPDSGSVSDDALAVLRELRDALQHSRWGALLPVLVDASFREPEVFERQRAFVRDRRGTLRAILQRGVERGELGPEVDVDILAERLAAPLFYRHLISHDPIGDAYLARLVDSTLADAGLAQRLAQRSAGSCG
jgi:AcrR family transcriptional regulator